MLKKIKSEKGITLLELIVTVALLSIVGTPIIIGIVNSSHINVESKDTTNGTVIGEEVCDLVLNGEIVNEKKTMSGRTYDVSTTWSGKPDVELETGGYQEEEGFRTRWKITQSGNSLNIDQYKDGAIVSGTNYSGFVIDPETVLPFDISTTGFSIVFKDDKLEIYADSNELSKKYQFKNLNITNDIQNIELVLDNSVPRVNLYNIMSDNKIANVYYDSVVTQKSKLNVGFEKNIMIANINNIGTTVNKYTRKKREYIVLVKDELGNELFTKTTYHIE